MNSRERWDDLRAVISAGVDRGLSRSWTALPVKVIEDTKDGNIAKLQPLIKGKKTDKTGKKTDVEMPVLGECPIQYSSGGGFTITHPVKVGDEGIAVFSARCIDAWWDKGGIQPQQFERRHNLSDGMYIPGIRSKPRKLGGDEKAAEGNSAAGTLTIDLRAEAPKTKKVSLDTLQIRTDSGEYYIELTKDTVNIICKTCNIKAEDSVNIETKLMTVKATDKVSFTTPLIETTGKINAQGEIHSGADVKAAKDVKAQAGSPRASMKWRPITVTELAEVTRRAELAWRDLHGDVPMPSPTVVEPPVAPTPRAAPVLVTAPAVTGSGTAGQPLACNTGSWTDAPTGYAYQWQRDGSNLTASGSSYVPSSSDVGHNITCVVTASNSFGSAAASSNSVYIIAAPTAPVLIYAPTISGSGAVGEAHFCTTGDWTGTPTNYTYSWQSGGTLVGAGSNTYTPVYEDYGQNIVCIVTATNALGPTSASSNVVHIVPVPVQGILEVSLDDDPQQYTAGQYALELPLPLGDMELVLTPGDIFQVAGALNLGTGGSGLINTLHEVFEVIDGKNFSALLTAIPGQIGQIAGIPNVTAIVSVIKHLHKGVKSGLNLSLKPQTGLG